MLPALFTLPVGNFRLLIQNENEMDSVTSMHEDTKTVRRTVTVTRQQNAHLVVYLSEGDHAGPGPLGAAAPWGKKLIQAMGEGV
jgi:hypothetical protein